MSVFGVVAKPRACVVETFGLNKAFNQRLAGKIKAQARLGFFSNFYTIRLFTTRTKNFCQVRGIKPLPWTPAPNRFCQNSSKLTKNWYNFSGFLGKIILDGDGCRGRESTAGEQV